MQGKLENSGEGCNLRKTATNPQHRDLRAEQPSGRVRGTQHPFLLVVSLGGLDGLRTWHCDHPSTGGATRLVGTCCEPKETSEFGWGQRAREGRAQQAGVLALSGDGGRETERGALFQAEGMPPWLLGWVRQ